MKINIVHDNTSNSIMNDAETLNYMFKRLKEKPKESILTLKITHVLNQQLIFFLGYVNSSFCEDLNLIYLFPINIIFIKIGLNYCQI